MPIARLRLFLPVLAYHPPHRSLFAEDQVTIYITDPILTRQRFQKRVSLVSKFMTGGRGRHAVGGDDDDQPTGAYGDAAFGEELAQALNGAADALAGGVFVRAERLAYFAE